MELLAAGLAIFGAGIAAAAWVAYRVSLRALAIKERQVAATEPQSAPLGTPAGDPMPVMLEEYAASESEVWARDDVRAAFLEARKERPDWEGVMRRVIE